MSLSSSSSSSSSAASSFEFSLARGPIVLTQLPALEVVVAARLRVGT
eukprot:CAMPEP_0174697042 /NCGR_PEP_ID=MMETSP1094-20130205/3020_1 /TAXON_ID=156173 /ORGANISM="Chrysochromulina brevifilum, Strain UTEX LB 985" /LENGTH=46 /DNA_ID= /DNA_START= /DNA_END= /DNA_ORIENTATION=